MINERCRSSGDPCRPDRQRVGRASACRQRGGRKPYVGAERVVREAADLRFVRHGAEYRAEAVGVQDVHDAITIGQELIDLLTPAVEKILNSAT